MNHLGIDVWTQDVKIFVDLLGRLKTTGSVRPGPIYAEDKNYAQVQLDTLWTIKELDDWLWRVKCPDYHGTFVRSES